MRELPAVVGREWFAALVIRTDYGDETAWQAVVAELMRPWGDEQYDAQVHLVDDPVWAGAMPDEVKIAVNAADDVSAAFLADATTMRGEHRALLAVRIRDEEWDDLEDEEWAKFRRPFRTEPSGVHDIHANLSIANMDFEEFGDAAQQDPDGVFRGF
ncbi:hypothetical protein ABIA33_003513 [Streptacidiphilus sp. MAP12-16]|uniref:DUF6924 domain-containing protein n=1 Tax=Streptacidiphilus sp. MAP12-16 TaxID=3156300 RepID=UPI003518C37A